MRIYSDNKLVKLIFFGNYFYGFCALSLTIETIQKHKYYFSSALYFILIFLSIVLFYTLAYVNKNIEDEVNSKKVAWYLHEKKRLIVSKYFFSFGIALVLILIIYRCWSNLVLINFYGLFLIIIFPLFSLFYYAINFKGSSSNNLRKIGWLKPFVIGFVWAGIVSTYPIIYNTIENAIVFKITIHDYYLFFQNFIFISALSILFDFKDRKIDSKNKLKTFVVQFGEKKTTIFVVMPLILICLFFEFFLGVFYNVYFIKIAINSLPYILTAVVAFSILNRKTILYYLLIVDGLMFIKGIFSIITINFF